jgi:HEAT repeat protein
MRDLPAGTKRDALILAGAVCLSVFAVLSVYWLVPDVAEGIRSLYWPQTEGRLLSVYKGVWSKGGSSYMPIGKGGVMHSYSGGYYGVSLRYYYHVGEGEDAKPHNGWRYDTGSSSRAFVALPGMSFPRPRWERVHPGLPWTYAGIAADAKRRGSSLTVYYDPVNPDRSVLRRGIGTDTILHLILAFCAAVAAFELWRLLREPERKPPTAYDGTTCLSRAVLVPFVGIVYLPLSLVLAKWFGRVLPPGVALPVGGVSLVYVLRPGWLRPILETRAVKTALLASAKPIVALLVLSSLACIVGGAVGWKPFGESVTAYVPSEEELVSTMDGDDPFLYSWASYRMVEHYLRAEHLPLLVRMVESPDEKTLRAGLHAIGKLGPEARAALSSVVNRLHDYEKAVYTIYDVEPKPVEYVPELIPLLASDEWDVRTKAMQLLGGCGPTAAAAVPALEDNLTHDNFRVRMGALDALGRIGAESSLQKIADALTDEKSEIRYAAVCAIRVYGARVADLTETIEALLDDEDKWVRIAAKETLRLIRSAR